jgi:glycosyltransferase involved in cell wall biosynthesis
MYIELPVSVGGSVTGLYQLVQGLDKDQYDPIVLFHGPNAYRTHFQAIGVQTLVLSENGAKPSTSQTAQSIGQTTSKRDIAARLSRHSEGLAEAYRLTRRARLVAGTYWPLGRHIARLIKEWNVSLVHNNNSLMGNRAGVIGAHLAGVPQVCHVRGLAEFSRVERGLASFVDAFIYMSRAVEQLYLDLGIPQEKGHVVYDGFNTEISAKKQAHECRAELGLTEQDKVITNVGRLDWWKGQDYFLQAIAQLVLSEPNIKALLVGSPDNNSVSQAFHQKLVQMVADLRLSDHVIFTGFRSDVQDLMAASDVVVHSSSEPEPFGRVVVEAQLMGRPVVATGAGGVLDIIQDRETGLLVPPQDADAMAQAIGWLLQNREQAETMGQCSRQRAQERFTVQQHITQVQHIYNSILATQEQKALKARYEKCSKKRS